MARAKPKGQRLAIVEEMTIYNAGALKQKIVEGLNSAEVLELDLAAVGEIDTAGFQLLVLAKREAARLGKQAPIVAHSQAVQEVVDFFHMAAEFGDPMLITPQAGK